MINNVQPEEDVYFYHPDHLGSASWISFYITKNHRT